jgi:hypothetical protein
MNEGGVNDVLTLSHIETPTGNGTVKDGMLVDMLNQQQIKTYALFPAQLSDVPGQPPATSTVVVSQPTASVTPEPATPAPEIATNTPGASPTPVVEPEPGGKGKGCLFGLFSIL